MADTNKIFTFAPMNSFVQPTFWHKLAEIKIDIDKLSDKPKQIYGYYTNINAKSCLLEVDYSSFNTDFKPPNDNFISHGTLYNKNTIEEFKDCNKIDLLNDEGKKLIDDIESGRILDDPSLLARYLVLSFADLKTHKFYYWFGFPCPMLPVSETITPGQLLQTNNPVLLEHLTPAYNKMPYYKNKMFFILIKEEDNYRHYHLNDFISSTNRQENFKNKNLDNIYFCFTDPSEFENPSWLLRVFICFLYITCPNLHNVPLQFIGIRGTKPNSYESSIIWKVKMIKNDSESKDMKFVGWELNQNDKMGPRLASMEDTMDEKKLAENSVLLNLKLMKWRLLTDLDLDLIADTSCLLLGAGTLGCSVARSLLAWGFKRISFVDSGIVRYSNPTRQSLYRHEDAVSANKPKAPTAAERVLEINPNAITKGYNLQIQMPGHTVGDSMRETLLKDLSLIEDLIKSHDVIFLLTDSRESRWLPTVLGAFHKKIVINAALGFDSYLVMRHGGRKNNAQSSETNEDLGDLKCVPGSELGCYFCNDVTAPGNSLKDRTLDQQCTVTRPGVSNIASSYAVELLVALLHHKDKESAPAYYSTTGKSEQSIPEGNLGIIPHSIRGVLGTFENIMPATKRFTQCVACSDIIINEFQKRGNEFLLDVFDSAKYLEDLTGITDFGDLENEIIECDDDDWDE